MEWNWIPILYTSFPFHSLSSISFPFVSVISLYPISICIQPFLLFSFFDILQEMIEITKITKFWYFCFWSGLVRTNIKYQNSVFFGYQKKQSLFFWYQNFDICFVSKFWYFKDQNLGSKRLEKRKRILIRNIKILIFVFLI